MNKRITSILLCFVMLFSMLVSAVPAYAAPANPPMVFDITGDGRINIMDVNRANLHFKKKITLVGYEFDCANVTGDTQVNIMDVNRLNLHFKGKSKLW